MFSNNQVGRESGQSAACTSRKVWSSDLCPPAAPGSVKDSVSKHTRVTEEDTFHRELWRVHSRTHTISIQHTPPTPAYDTHKASSCAESVTHWEFGRGSAAALDANYKIT